MDELADAVRMDPMEFRIKNLPPLAPNAMWRRYFPMGAERIGWSQSPSDRRSHARPDQARPRLLREPVGRRRAGHARPLRDPPGRQRAHSIGHAGHRHRDADADGDDHRRDARAQRRSDQGRARRQQSPVQRRQRRFDDRGVGVAGDSRDERHGARSAVRTHRSRDEDDGRSARDRRRPRGGQRRRPRRSRGATPASCSGRSRCRWTASGSAGSRPAARPACSSPTSRSTSRPASRA